MAASDIRQELADLKRRFAELEHESRANFGQMAVAIRRSRRQVLENELSHSVRKLAPPVSLLDWTPRQGEAADPAIGASLIDRLRKGESVSDTLGNTAPTIGQANLLRNAILEGNTGVILTSTAALAQPDWEAYYVLNSGTLPADIQLDDLYDRGDANNNPFNSVVMELSTGLQAAAYDLDVYIRPETTFSPSSIPSLPYLVASCRVLTFGNAVPAEFTTARVRLEIFDGTNVIASSEWVNFSELTELSMSGVRQLVAATTGTWTSGAYRWRLRVNLVKTAAGNSSMVLYYGEPQLHFAYSPDPLPFSPAIGGWVPDLFRYKQNADENYRMQINGTSVLWGGGGADWEDVRLWRSAAQVLTLDDNAHTGAAILALEGSFRQSGTSFPTTPTPASGDRFYRSDSGLHTDFRYDGTRWNSVNRHVLPLQNVLALPIAASSTPTRAPVPPMGTGTDLNLKELATAFYVDGGTALDASNKWVGSFRKVDASTPTTIATVTIDSGTSTTWRRTVTALDVLLGGTGYEELEVIWQKTGTPGNLYVMSTLSYYLVST